MNKNLSIAILGIVGAGGAVLFFLLKEDKEEFILSNGVKGTSEELIKKGYIPISVGGKINWVLKTEYDKALQDANGEPDLLVNILDIAGAFLPVVSSIVRTFRK